MNMKHGGKYENTEAQRARRNTEEYYQKTKTFVPLRAFRASVVKKTKQK